MRAEKKAISAQYLQRLNQSPFFYVVDYTGLKVLPMTELRKRLTRAGAEIHVVKNTIFRIAAKEAGVDLAGVLTGQLAVVTGQKDAAAAAKALKTFVSEFERPKVKFGFISNQRLEASAINELAELPPLDTLRATLIGLIQSPAQRLAVLLKEPAAKIARLASAYGAKQN